MYQMVHLVLHPHGIAPIFLKFDLLSPGAVFISIISIKGINQIKKGKFKEKRFMHTKRFNTFFKDGCNSVWVQFHFYCIKCCPGNFCYKKFQCPKNQVEESLSNKDHTLFIISLSAI